MRIEKILVAVDLSEASREALRKAIDLSAQCDAQLDILYVWEAPGYDGARTFKNVAEAPLDSKLRQSFEVQGEDLRRFLDESNVRLDSRIRSSLRVGTPWRRICEVASEGAHDLIVMGTHGRSGIARAVMGSVADHVIRHAPCGVLSLRADVQSDG